MGNFYSLWGLLVLAAAIWAIVNIIQNSANSNTKILWTLLIVFLPLIGSIIWFFAGPKSGKA